jgi:hypothetical protein
VRERMTALNVSTAALSRKTGLSGTTIRYLARGTNTLRQASTLATVSAALGWPHGYLRSVADRGCRPPGSGRVADQVPGEGEPLRRGKGRLDGNEGRQRNCGSHQAPPGSAGVREARAVRAQQ